MWGGGGGGLGGGGGVCVGGGVPGAGADPYMFDAESLVRQKNNTGIVLLLLLKILQKARDDMLPTRKRIVLWWVSCEVWRVSCSNLQARYVLLSLSGHRQVTASYLGRINRQRLIDVFLRFTEPSEAWRLGDYI